MQDITTRPRKPFIAAIIPIFNEKLNLGGFLEVLRATTILDEIILVDDGSTDGSLELLKQVVPTDRRFQLIQHKKNLGKGQAIFDGWVATGAPVLLLLDADLKNLTPKLIEALLEPVIKHKADMTIGLFRHGHLAMDISHWITPFLTGQRGLRAEILNYISHEAAAGYGFEVALTVAAGQRGYRTRVVPLTGVWHTPSEFRSERGFWGGARWKLNMYGQIIRAWVVATRERYPNAKAFFSDIGK